VTRSADSPGGPRKLALLVGIDRYRSPNIPELRGCRNDVEAMRSLLIGSYGFHADEIHVLLDDKATYNGILNEFRQHLLRASSGDIVVFQYSGHGSREHSSTSASGQGETIVPHDSRDPKNLDITAEAMSSLFGELAKRTKNITAILDSCHSGRMIGVARDINDNVAVREIEPPSDPAPAPPSAPPRARALNPAPGGFQPLDDSFVLMASVLPSQLAKEYRSGGKSYGAMTFFLLRELSTPRPASTYRSVMDVVALRVAEAVSDQTPQVVGPNADRYLFGIALPPVIPYTLAHREGNVVRLPYCGTAHGIAEGARYAVYAQPPAPSASPAAWIVVTKANDFDSLANAEKGVAPDIGYAVLLERGIKSGPLAIWLDPSPALNQARAAIAKERAFQILPDRMATSLQVTPISGGTGIFAPDGLAMFDRSLPISNPTVLIQELKRWANWFSMLELSNAAPDMPVKVRLKPAKPDPTERSLAQLGRPEMILKAGSVYTPVVDNLSDRTLYMTLLALSSDRGIAVIFPAKGDANAAFEVQARSERRLPAIRASLPDCLSLSRDVLLLFASTQAVSFFPFVQDGFCGGKRNFNPLGVGDREWVSSPGKWSTARLVVEIRP
jgi:hypothetical protein